MSELGQQNDVTEILERVEKARRLSQWNNVGFTRYIDELDVEYLLRVIEEARQVYMFWRKSPRSLSNRWGAFLKTAGYKKSGYPVERGHD